MENKVAIRGYFDTDLSNVYSERIISRIISNFEFDIISKTQWTHCITHCS